MEFIFLNKNDLETDIITTVLIEEKIPFYLKKKVVKTCLFSDDIEEDDVMIIEEFYDIHTYTDLNHFDFVKIVANKKIEEIKKLERCFKKKVSKKDVCGLLKKNITNTNNRYKDKR